MLAIGNLVYEVLTPAVVAAHRGMVLSFGKLWNLVDSFKIEQKTLFLISEHPAFHWEIRLRKGELLKSLKIYGIDDICVRRHI